MLKKAIIFSSLSIFCSVHAWGAVEFRIDRDGGSLEHSPVLNQGSIGICHAYAATQIWDAHLRVQTGSQKPTSPEYLAVHSAQRKFGGDGHFEAGLIVETIDFLNQHGSCLRSYTDRKPEFSQEILKTSSDYFRNQIKIQNREFQPMLIPQGLEWMEPHRLRIQAEISLREPEWLAQQEKEKALAVLHGSGAKYNPASLSNPGFKNSSTAEFQARLMNLECPKSFLVQAERKLNVHQISYWNSYSLKDLEETKRKITENAKIVGELAEINFQLQGALPIGIEYCSAFLKSDPSFSGVHSILKNGPCDLHASILVGVRLDPSGNRLKHQVLIRNSWGTTCDNYHPSLKCEQGQIWVSVEQLQRNLMRFVIAR